MSQKMQRQLQRQQHGGLTSIKSKVSGTVSSVSFTPVQGIEIVNPVKQEAPSGSSSTYFSATSNFVKVETPMPK